MKILHFKSTMALEEGGVVKAVLDLCVLAQNNHDVGLATFQIVQSLKDWNRDEQGNDRIQIHSVGDHLGPAGALTSESKKKLKELIKQYDVVHLHSMWSTPNPQVAKICRDLGVPYVLSIHGMLDDWCMSQRKPKKLLYMNTWGRNLLRDAKLIHCTAEAEYDQSKAWYDPSKGRVVPLPLDLDEFKELPEKELAYESFDGLRKDVPKILFLSRINYKKGVDRLIRASALLAKSGVEHQLVIAGTGEDSYVNEMKQLARSEGAENHTYFLGFASGEPKIALYRACDLFVLPTSQENFGFVFYESLAAGTTLITTKGVDTWKELEQDGKATICAEDPETVAQAMKKLLEDPEDLESRSAQGRAWIFEHMNPEQITHQYDGLYQELSK